MVTNLLSPVFGLITSKTSNTTLTVTAGNAFDLFNVVKLILESNTIINGAINGINGLDTGSLGADTFYAAYIIGSQDNIQPIGLILSEDFKIPLLPNNYDAYRRIGLALTDGSSHFINLIPSNSLLEGSNVRIYSYPSPISVLSAGTSDTYADVDLSGSVPILNSLLVNLNFTYTPNNGGNFFSVIIPGPETNIPSQIANTANVPLEGIISAVSNLVMGAPSVQYLVQTGDELDLSVYSFQDYF